MFAYGHDPSFELCILLVRRFAEVFVPASDVVCTMWLYDYVCPYCANAYVLLIIPALCKDLCACQQFRVPINIVNFLSTQRRAPAVTAG